MSSSSILCFFETMINNERERERNMSDKNNPYSAPEANLLKEAAGGAGIAAIKQIPRFSTWAVVGLAMITMGIYAYYWLYSRTKMINKLIPENPIAKWLPVTTITIVALYWVMSMLPLLFLGGEGDASSIWGLMMMIAPLLNIIVLILFYVWVYALRNRINQISGAQKGDMFWLGGIITFFFNAYYFQYKINEMHDKG